MKNTNNLLTIVIPSYNEERYIYNTLWQISRQKEINGTRVIISDANSTDKTIEYINKASNDFPKLKIELTEGGHTPKGRNNGAKLVNTPYILFMDADSVLQGSEVITEVKKYLNDYEIISCKQKSITSDDKKSVWTYKILDWIRKKMPITFCTGCFFLIS